jgi:hypothetical protein
LLGAEQDYVCGFVQIVVILFWLIDVLGEGLFGEKYGVKMPLFNTFGRFGSFLT